MSRIGPTPKPPLVTSTRSGSPGAGSRTAAMRSKAGRTGMPVDVRRARAKPCATHVAERAGAGTQSASSALLGPDGVRAVVGHDADERARAGGPSGARGRGPRAAGGASR